ncbi:MBL fold metallo-hydrolase [Allosaccharopolyspora coralli]|uniref:MBL fold metallo-hydrolase n=1 Tax=Allosaccharopolyspora coralli TaxID=2665642 RepID=A0A5Q3Q3J2_9PSEU|nr:MBL fold metallo-hydrolase [Allosaccharopolyspora coralli]QGK69178.1 MBL fold metallo-hydrolase [Allosaccharopolyspora coralli]
MSEWSELADGVFVRRYTELDLTVGLVVGAEQALVVDTRGDRAQGAELAAAVREVTELPWQIVLTHGHFDHCFGTEAFLPAPVWAHERCARFLDRTAEVQRTTWAEHYRAEGSPDTVEALVGTSVVRPDHLVSEHTTLDLGGRRVRLLHLGSGHTDHDLVVETDAVVFAGDLVEQGAPPDFEDAHPESWPSTMDSLLDLGAEVVVPGHGNPVTADFVREQQANIAELAELCRNHRLGLITASEAEAESPYPGPTTRTALDRTTR